MNQNMLIAGFQEKVKFTLTMKIQLGVIFILFILTLIIGYDAYEKFTLHNDLNNAVDKYNERYYSRAKHFLDNAAPPDTVMQTRYANFHFILAFLNGDIEAARKFNEMLQGDPDFENEYIIGKKLLWSLDHDEKSTDDVQLSVHPNTANVLISNGYSYLQLGKFDESFAVFEKALNCKQDDEISAPTRDGCVAAYNGIMLAFLGKKLGTLDGSQPLNRLSLTDLEQLLSYLHSAKMYLTPYSPTYYNIDRVYSTYVYRMINGDNDFETLFNFLNKSKKELNINQSNPANSNKYFDDLNERVKWIEIAEKNKKITNSASLPENALWKHRVKILIPAYACLLAELSAKATDELKMKYDSDSEKFWDLVFNYFPDSDEFRRQHFVCRLRIFQGAKDKMFRKLSAQKVKKLMELEANKKMLETFNRSKIRKLQTVINAASTETANK